MVVVTGESLLWTDSDQATVPATSAKVIATSASSLFMNAPSPIGATKYPTAANINLINFRQRHTAVFADAGQRELRRPVSDSAAESFYLFPQLGCPLLSNGGQNVAMPRLSALCGGFNRSTQRLLILQDGEVRDGSACTDMVHAEAKGGALGTLEERSMCCGYRPSAREEEQERGLSDLGPQWRDCSGAAPEGSANAEACGA